jgi:hypothetical protein
MPRTGWGSVDSSARRARRLDGPREQRALGSGARLAARPALASGISLGELEAPSENTALNGEAPMCKRQEPRSDLGSRPEERRALVGIGAS